MAEAIKMPKMSDTMEEGVIVKWNVKVGDTVESGDIIAEVETDKATMDMESYYDGTVLHLAVKEGEAAPIDAVIAVVGEKGEDFQALLDDSPAETKEEEAKPEESEATNFDVSDINAVVVRMPLLTDTMEEGVIHKWLKKVGDEVSSGDALAEVETDKATMEIEAYDDGVLLYTAIGDGDSVPVNGIIAVIGEKGADYETLLKAESAGSSTSDSKSEVKEETKTSAPAPKVESAPAAATPASDTGGRIFASPLAKRIAKEKGIDLSQVSGSGENGRIIKVDVENFVPAAAPAKATAAATDFIVPVPVGEESYEEIPLTQMRKAIARSLSASQTSAVDFSVTMEINMDNAIKARKAMNETSPVKISFNDMVLKASAAALRKHPEVNSSWREDHIRKNHHIHIGMAVAVESGLIVPVIRFVDTLPLSVIAASTRALGGKAKEGKLQPAEWEGNTFTVSNLGMMGVDSFNSIINNPKNESCILSVGAIKETVAVKDGQFYATNIMKVTLTCDHRVVDGALGAAFLVTFRELLEEPYKLLV